MDVPELLTRRAGRKDADAMATVAPLEPAAPHSAAQVMETVLRADTSAATEPSPASSEPLGGLVADLRLGELLGMGGSATVHLATQPSLDRQVAVKTLRTHRRDSQSVAALFREACVAGRLDHPNIVPVHALGMSSAHGPYLVMKRVDGASWLERLADVDRSASRALRRELDIFMDVCRAVAFSHDKGIVHRDIKPANVMVGHYGEVYLLDWGAALYLEEDSLELRREFVGTPAYMAPEQVDPEAAATPLTDVYLLGASLCHVLTGHPPHCLPSPADSVSEVLDRALASRPIAFGHEVHEVLGAIVNKACAPQPEDRFASAEELRESVADYLDREGAWLATERADRERSRFFALLDEADTQAPVGQTQAWRDADLARDTEVQRAFSVCRFAYQQALEQWPANAQAADGLKALVTRMATYELKRDNPGAAGALIGELQEPPAKLVRQLEVARAEAQQRADALDEVRAIHRERRFHGVDWVRSGSALAGGIIALLAGWLLGRGIRGGLGLGPEALVIALGLGAAMSHGVAHVYRRTMMDSARFRMFLRAYGTTLGSGAALVALGWAGGLELSEVWFPLCAMGAVAAGVMAVTVERSMWVCALLAAAIAPMTLWFPDYQADVVGGGLFANGLYMAWLLRPGQSEARLKGPSEGQRLDPRL